MEQFSIQCKYIANPSTFDTVKIKEDEWADYKTPISISNQDNDILLKIICDNIDDNNSFTMTYYGMNGVTIDRKRCFLNVHVGINDLKVQRTLTIICTHNNNPTTSITIEIKQDATQFSIGVSEMSDENNEENLTDKLEVRLNSEVMQMQNQEGDGMRYEERVIYIQAKGGSGKYKIIDIGRYHTSNNISIRHDFDDGFIFKTDVNTITIKNYGRPFIDQDDYYVIRLQHCDVLTLEAEIKITYAATATNHNNVSLIKSDTIAIPQISEIYKTEEERQTVLFASDIANAIEDVTYVITVYKDNNKKDAFEYKSSQTDETINELPLILIKNSQTIISLPYEVIKQQKEQEDAVSDLACIASSTAYWCRAKANESKDSKGNINRTLGIQIINKPISFRQCIITLKIIDEPDVVFMALVRNIFEEEKEEEMTKD